ncbi:MAG TPA: protein-glutamate O-methyltransferase CheR [Longimicrobiaceae bacterium]|nr:protein-glutamate O-methyltransferase CheR [Longimicrobiaceae bacterium]
MTAAELADSVSDLDFSRFQALVYREAGIHLAPCKKPLLAGRLSRRMRELGISSLAQYYRRVGEQPDELVRMLDAISTNETHFFREPAHFDVLRSRILPAWQAEAAAGRRPRRLRAWSAACSTGQEPYTLAMVLLDHLGGDGWEIEVQGTDLSTRVLETARGAVWPLDLAREIPRPYLKKYMLRGTGSQADRMMAGPEIRALVRFSRLNLNADDYAVQGQFDLIFCRNVLIYFDAASKRRVVDRLVDRLAPGGLLFMGHAESLTTVTTRVRPVLPTVYAVPPSAGAGG